MSTQQQEVITLDVKEDESREEGEIVDEFEYILSSEDEETLTKRIRELEARNDELEKIATISGAGTNYPADVFEISDYEDDYYFNKVDNSRGQGKRKTHNQNFRTIKHKPVKKRRPRKKKKPLVKPPRAVIKEDESPSSDSDNEPLVSKDILRFAVETQNLIAPNKRNLRDRLILDKGISDVKVKEEVEIKEEVKKDEPEEEEESFYEEQELRLMALKSAIINRHSDRVKRKKESTAYSPSDFEAVLNQSPILPEEGTETPNMDISPIASPASLSEEDVNPIDMDIENSEEEEFPISRFQEEFQGKDDIPKPRPIYHTPDNEQEEEEEALRALLLSKMISPKVPKVTQNDENQENSEESMAALILKKAVQRLQEKKLICDIVEKLSEEAPPKVLETEEKVLREKPQENHNKEKTVPLEKKSLSSEKKILPLEKKVPVPEKKILKKRKTEQIPTVVLPKKPKTSLITSVPTNKVKKLVISLQNTTDEDEDHELCGDIFTKHFLSTNISLDSENYAEAASPSSLLFVENSTSSPSTPRSNSPFVSGTTELPAIKKQITNDVFEAKLDTFLKNARSQVEQSAIKEVEAKKTVQGTPMAVRHLPESSREEYRKLIKRMELLEKQKELGLKKLQQTQQQNKVDTIKITIKNNPTPAPKRIVIKTSTASTVSTKPTITSTVSTPASIISVTSSKPASPLTIPPKPAQTPVNKAELFHKVETQYNKNESLLMENLTKNLVLVETAMISKKRKLELEARLSILAKEMKTIESNLKEENTKINKIYPQIRFLHKTMEDLKSKRSRLYKYANTLGKTVKNGQISLKDIQRGQINAKYKNLATSMKTLKALNKDHVTLTKDFSTQVELEVVEDQKSNDRDEASPKKVFTLTIYINKSIKIRLPSEPSYNNINHLPFHNIHFLSAFQDTEEEVVKNVQTEAEPLLEPEDEEDQLTLGAETERLKTDERILKWSNEYVSPLSSIGCSKDTSGKLDPNVIICPYALIGRCVDKDCKYNHI
ncbi:hypothetical protein ACFFRR_011491 [Megaselia abdita]